MRLWSKTGSAESVRYWYIGRTIDAAIHHDGSVEIRNKHGVNLSLTSTQTLTRSGSPVAVRDEKDQATIGSPSAPGLALGITDPARTLSGWATGREPPNVEARQFLSDTLPLRERLLNERAREARRQGRLRLHDELRKLWSRQVPLRSKQRDTFRIWDDCAEDETGNEGRRVVEAYVHTLEASHGECPYDAELLRQLNENRKSKAVFAPCTRATDGGVTVR